MTVLDAHVNHHKHVYQLYTELLDCREFDMEVYKKGKFTIVFAKENGFGNLSDPFSFSLDRITKYSYFCGLKLQTIKT